MGSIRSKTEAYFSALSKSIVKYPWLVLITVIVFTSIVGPQIRNGWTDLSSASFLSTNDPAVMQYDDFRLQFGNPSFGLVLVETEKSIFTLETLARIKALHEEIEASVPHIEKMDSLVNVRYSRSVDDELTIDDLVDLWPTTDAEMPAFKKLVMSNKNYVGNLVSSNERLSGIVIKLNNYSSRQKSNLLETDDKPTTTYARASKDNFLHPEEEAEFGEAIIKIAEKHSVEGFKLHSGGTPVVNYRIGRDIGIAMQRDMSIGLLVIVVLLGILFRRASGVLLPMTAVVLSLWITLALMPIFGVPFTGSTQILPTFLLAIGIADAIHILSIFYRRYDSGEEKMSAIVGAMKQTSTAIVMTTITTAAGLLSFAASDLMPTQTLGIFGAVGVFLALFYTVVLMPALLAIAPIKRKPMSTDKGGMLALIDKVIESMGEFGVKHAKGIFAISLLLIAISVIGITKITFSHDPVRWNPPDHPLRVGTELIDREMSGSNSMQVLFDTGEKRGLYDPAVLKLLESAEALILDTEVNSLQAKKVSSILDVVKETHQSLLDGDPKNYIIPDNRELVAQELFLFELSGSDDMEELTDNELQLARLSAIIPWKNIANYPEYLNELHRRLDKLVLDSGLENVSYTISGLTVIFQRTWQAMMRGTIESYIVAFGLVGILMFILMGNVRRGLLAFIPNVVPILFTIGMMGWAEIPLNMLTTLVGCIIIGISVDDTIHFMHHYRQFAKTSPPIDAVRKTLATTGRAITFTSIVLVGGFMVHLTDQFETSRQFGFLLSFSILIALLANLILAPALLKLFWKSERKVVEQENDFSNENEVSVA